MHVPTINGTISNRTVSTLRSVIQRCRTYDDTQSGFMYMYHGTVFKMQITINMRRDAVSMLFKTLIEYG